MNKFSFLSVLTLSLSALATEVSFVSSVEGNTFSPYSNKCELLSDRIAKSSFNGTTTLEIQSSQDFDVIHVPARRLAVGNCVAPNNLPRLIQLKEGELFQQDVFVSGTGAYQKSYNTIFLARWDRPTPDTIRVYGGCTWKYTCGPMSGFSEIIYTSK